ncbi:MAG: hypothetical protein J6Y70_00815 [Bacilli bacterium]|nr:hypothetical protein [Bacilli bacterium]
MLCYLVVIEKKRNLVKLSLFSEIAGHKPETEERLGCKTGDNKKYNCVYAKIKDWKSISI